MTLTRKDITEAVNEVLTARRSIDETSHFEHHNYVGALIERERKRTERNEKIKTQVIGWGVVTAIGGIGYAIWEAVKASVR